MNGTLGQYFNQVFLVMGFGIAFTGIVAFLIEHDESAMRALFNVTTYVNDGKTKTGIEASTIWYVSAAAELGIVLVLSLGGLTRRLGAGAAITLFVLFAGLNGVTLAPVIHAYTAASVTKVFFITAAMFGGCAFWGITTKADLRGMGSFFLMGLIGLIVAMLVNAFFASPAADYAISVVAVLLFAGLTAYDMQKIEQNYVEAGGQYDYGLVVVGALELYLDFLNLFIHLLRLFGTKSND